MRMHACATARSLVKMWQAERQNFWGKETELKQCQLKTSSDLSFTSIFDHFCFVLRWNQLRNFTTDCKLPTTSCGVTTICPTPCKWCRTRDFSLRLDHRACRDGLILLHRYAQSLKWGGLGGSAPLHPFEPPAIVWAPLIESIKCYFTPK